MHTRYMWQAYYLQIARDNGILESMTNWSFTSGKLLKVDEDLTTHTNHACSTAEEPQKATCPGFDTPGRNDLLG